MTRSSKNTEIKEKNQVQWSYEGNTGPDKWGELAPEYALCSTGESQSPIDIRHSKIQTASEVSFNYMPAKASVINNGHTIQVNISNGDNSILIDNIQYKLTQFHFHTPSEHTINGKSFSMELHLVHQDAHGNLAVVGIMIKNGIENKIFSPIWNKISSQEKGQEIELETPVDIAQILPEDSSIYRYSGSLTTPPCTEGVVWLVLDSPIEMSDEQISIFKSIFPFNNRPIQKLNGREIIKYN